MVLGVMRATERPTFESEASKVIYGPCEGAVLEEVAITTEVGEST